MPSLQIRDMPEEVYEALSDRAQRERRSLAQQAIADLARVDEIEARQQRSLTTAALRDRPTRRKLSDPVAIVRKDRER